MNRRHFCKAASLLLASTSLSGLAAMGNNEDALWFMPEEGEPHTRTWMCFIANEEIWSRRQIPEVQRNLILIAASIAQYESVSLLTRSQDHQLATQLLSQYKTRYPVTLVPLTMDDLWIRDTGPTFVLNNIGKKAAIDFNFNGWGEKQTYSNDRKVAQAIADTTDTPIIHSTLSLEGGCFEVDGRGTAIMTESCIINNNRNPGRSKQEIDKELKALLGLEKIIWLKGIKGKDITDGHTDFYARFAKPGVVVVSRENDPSSYDYAVTRENIKQLSNETDAQGRPLELVILDTPEYFTTRYGEENFAPGYVGYYLCNNALIMQKFGDRRADKEAREKLQALFPDREIKQIAIDGIASGGGSIHCATQQEPELHVQFNT